MNKKIRLFLMLLVLVLSVGSASAQKKIYIVSAGIADYPGTNMDLTLCANDAVTIKGVFAKNKRSNTILLTNSQATRAAVLTALQQQFAKAFCSSSVVMAAREILSAMTESWTTTALKTSWQRARHGRR